MSAADNAQRAAANPADSVFVTANAGSGKTKVLVDRIARLLLEGSRPSAFLCITYTKAAAAEMQRRLFERLGAWCVADDGTLAAELAQLGAPNAKLSDARALFARALETPGGLKIQTIHAFCERLLARFPLEASVPPGFQIADEARAAALLAQARARAALSAEAEHAAAFERFATRLYGEGLEALLNRLALRRAEFRRFAQQHQGALFAETFIKNRHGVRLGAEEYSRSWLARQDWSALRRAAEALGQSSANNVKTAQRIAAALTAFDREPAAEAAAALIRVAIKGDGEAYAALVTKTLAAGQPWLGPFLDRLVESCVEARAALNAIERAEDACAALNLALKLDGAYTAAKHLAGALDFDDLIAHAHDLLQKADAAPWVLYKLDGGLDHILIDEGQDTSPNQWELVTPLLDEFFAGAGARQKPRTAFTVGDYKQSIYAFQGADPDRFLSEAQNLERRARRAKQGFAGPTLETSFRSTPEVLQAVDQTLRGKDIAPGAPDKFNEVHHLAARKKEAGLVEVWPLAKKPETKQHKPWDAPQDVEFEASVHVVLARAIARRAKQWIDAGEAVWENGVLRPMRAGDILVLVRTRAALFRELIKAFKRQGFPVAGADRMVLRDELAVEDCLALMRVALDPADDLSLACVLKGPWCDLTDDDRDLFPLAYGRARGETLHARLMASAEPRFAFARAFVRELTARRGQEPFAFLSWALEGMHGGETGWRRVFARLGMESRDPLQELLQRALKPSAHAAATLQRFLFEVEFDAGQVKRELEAETGAVRVMTVHGAKGLEAPVVILPDSTGRVEAEFEDNLLFTKQGPYFSQRKKDDDAVGARLRSEHEARMEGEHWRLLYVAMTRGRDRLVVCGAERGNVSAGEHDKAWRLAVQQGLERAGATPCETPFGEGLRLGAVLTAPGGEASHEAAPRLPAWAQAPAPGARVEVAAPSRVVHIDPALFSPRGDGRLRFQRGRLIHSLLQRLPDLAPERREAAAYAWLARQGVAEDLAAALTREALDVIGDARFAAVFGPASRAEAPIVGAVGSKAVRGVVDRLMVEDARVLVLDYKTDRPAPRDVVNAPEPYVLQMALYRAVLRQIFPAHSVACALLWTEAPHLMALPEDRLDAALHAYVSG
ncbi:MAG: double-strand break repair helicase AddA [Hyphomonadaceae bacterium]|nr:double-strand break repair helicase AddA [Hyphomonadaceae bacterium]